MYLMYFNVFSISVSDKELPQSKQHLQCGQQPIVDRMKILEDHSTAVTQKRLRHYIDLAWSRANVFSM